jgi:hypothetical protein
MQIQQKIPVAKYCVNCSLPSNFPAVCFDDKGFCNYCHDFRGLEHQELKKSEYSRKFDVLINEYKGRYSYDALVCYSGGKDSTYTLAILKQEYDLNVLAVSFDNGFIPEQTLKNIHCVVEKLGVDHILVKPRFNVLAKIFSYCAEHEAFPLKALERSSAICTSCMAIIKYSALRLAIEKNIPLIAYGWSPGQAPISSSILKNIPEMAKKMQQTLYEPLLKMAGDDISPYFPGPQHYSESYQFPYNINPLAFLDYDIDTIYKSIERLGWRKPKKVDANSTNCLLNSYANFIHKQRLGFHPYAFELSNLVRAGYLGRETAISRLKDEEDPSVIKMVKDKINRGKSIIPGET